MLQKYLWRLHSGKEMLMKCMRVLKRFWSHSCKSKFVTRLVIIIVFRQKQEAVSRVKLDSIWIVHHLRSALCSNLTAILFVKHAPVPHLSSVFNAQVRMKLLLMGCVQLNNPCFGTNKI